MKNRIVKIVILSVILLSVSTVLTGCHKMYFHNGPVSEVKYGDGVAEGDWHHEFVFELIEASDPVALENQCSGTHWDSVKVERTFVNGLLSSITWGIYGQWSVIPSCG